MVGQARDAVLFSYRAGIDGGLIAGIAYMVADRISVHHTRRNRGLITWVAEVLMDQAPECICAGE